MGYSIYTRCGCQSLRSCHLEISINYYQFIETNRRQKEMTIDMAFRLSKALQIPLERIIAYELH